MYWHLEKCIYLHRWTFIEPFVLITLCKYASHCSSDFLLIWVASAFELCSFHNKIVVVRFVFFLYCTLRTGNIYCCVAGACVQFIYDFVRLLFIEAVFPFAVCLFSLSLVAVSSLRRKHIIPQRPLHLWMCALFVLCISNVNSFKTNLLVCKLLCDHSVFQWFSASSLKSNA